MRNDYHHLDVTLTRTQMLDLIINRKEIKTTTKKGELISISKPSSVIYNTDQETDLTTHTVFSRFTLESGVFLGHVILKPQGKNKYSGTVVYQEE